MTNITIATTTTTTAYITVATISATTNNYHAIKHTLYIPTSVRIHNNRNDMFIKMTIHVHIRSWVATVDAQLAWCLFLYIDSQKMRFQAAGLMSANVPSGHASLHCKNKWHSALSTKYARPKKPCLSPVEALIVKV